LFCKNYRPIWLNDKPFWSGTVNKKNGHGAIRVEPADRSVDFIAEEQAPLPVESQVVRSSDAS
jgi:hypothetical protein